MSWLKRFFLGEDIESIRNYAVRKGFSVTSVAREVPYFSKRNSLEKLEVETCIRYALPRQYKGVSWSLLQRDKRSGAQLPNGYLVKADAVTQDLLDLLKPVALEYTDDFYEFEATNTDIAVFWAEWGDNAQVDQLIKTLVSLGAVS